MSGAARPDMNFPCTYQGALYPADTEPPPATTSPVPCLVELSATKIVLDAGYTKRALEFVPNDLCYSLMKAAVSLSRDRSIEILIAHWPFQVLSLRKFAPPLFDDIGSLHDHDYVSNRMRRGVKYTTSLAHTFVECLKLRAKTKLRYLDLSGYPAAEVIVNYLSSHVLLVYNELRQREIIHMYNEVTQDLPTEQRQHYSLDSTLPEDSFVIHLDAFMQTPETHMELCRALKTARMEGCQFKLCLRRLDVSCLGVPRISVLLDQIDPQFLTALSLKMNSLSYPGLIILTPALQRLTSLTAIDLSCNGIHFTGENKASDMIQSVFAAMPLLVRLDLSSNCIRGQLRPILSRIQRPLQYLRLAGCCLTPSDLCYLGNSHHASQLTELDLSDNRLGQHFSLVATLLAKMADTLVILEMEDTQLEEMDIIDMFKSARCLCKLQFWNIAKLYELSDSSLMEHIGDLVAMAMLRTVRLSFPSEVYVSTDEDEIEHEKSVFERQSTNLLNSLCERKGRDAIAISYTA
ncbi:hypothetical protein CAPTEDRAFT_190719 [Capitella teleta]|uniref:Leucine-rich repeat-containing protein 14 n=1 Tax=Capitella teleta TaxID=283909 RepID=R7TRD9_CAPTE|nr:hypothetical protein CAPTEDRAFT_190719 [Capitella teleta]|eukprot:ELT96473.1 hypothetical protein CAPTEDRAFT_190719 [Capitella teleta]